MNSKKIFLVYICNQINICTLNIRKTALATSKTPVKNTAKTADHFGKIGQIDIFDTRYGIAGIATKIIFDSSERNTKKLTQSHSRIHKIRIGFVKNKKAEADCSEAATDRSRNKESKSRKKIYMYLGMNLGKVKSRFFVCPY